MTMRTFVTVRLPTNKNERHSTPVPYRLPVHCLAHLIEPLLPFLH
jgi:hypothetical protein